MIAAAVDPSDRALAAEFFELFKTPWQFWEPTSTAEVLLSTTRDVPPAAVRLMILFGSQEGSRDRRLGIRKTRTFSGAWVKHRTGEFPLHTPVAGFDGSGTPLLRLHGCNESPAVRLEDGAAQVVRVGFDLFAEIQHLLTHGQPPEHAAIPTLDRIIDLVRGWILMAGVPFVEVPPVPANHRFFICLTHDVDFIGIRMHRCDHTLFGFLYRALVGSLVTWLSGKLPIGILAKNWAAVARLPLVFMGWARDFWDDFDEYRDIEAGCGSTFFIIPFRHRPGRHVVLPHPERRASRYDVSDVADRLQDLQTQDCEVGVHGIDAWHDSSAADQEKQRIAAAIGRNRLGIRMHWLCFGPQSPRILDRAGFDYDASFGFNETVGYRAGTGQVFQPMGAHHLLELPLHIQDVALLQGGCSPTDALRRCRTMMSHAVDHGGVLTLLWHTRSLGPERFWGGVYRELIRRCIADGARVTHAQGVVDWFRLRRTLRFQETVADGGMREVRFEGLSDEAAQVLLVRLYTPLDPGGLSELEYRDLPLNLFLRAPLRLPRDPAESATQGGAS